jgi:hypothetical protein
MKSAPCLEGIQWNTICFVVNWGRKTLRNESRDELNGYKPPPSFSFKAFCSSTAVQPRFGGRAVQVQLCAASLQPITLGIPDLQDAGGASCHVIARDGCAGANPELFRDSTLSHRDRHSRERSAPNPNSKFFPVRNASSSSCRLIYSPDSYFLRLQRVKWPWASGTRCPVRGTGVSAAEAPGGIAVLRVGRPPSASAAVSRGG